MTSLGDTQRFNAYWTRRNIYPLSMFVFIVFERLPRRGENYARVLKWAEHVIFYFNIINV